MKQLYQQAECRVELLTLCDLFTLSQVGGIADGDDDSYDPGILG